ncbi:MAG: 5-formyltetrahydrofolate cyclo-ligase [Bacteroidales bacterium]|nr:5-formyltetrahydrofolate cyclo-ligase [Bacteroidales bacterium]MCF8334236.1 5-formyltetrahydrofolate cyclo-ligase [Bacteroidales bacterium]
MNRLSFDKKKLRQRIKEQKKRITFEDKQKRSAIIMEKLEQDENFQKAHTIMCYWSMKDEVHTHDFIRKWHPSKRIILPSVKGEELELKVYEGPDSMKEGEKFAILEPTGASFTELSEFDLAIIPGVAFDKNHNRMGRGKAYYDKLLQSISCPKYGICFDFQFMDEIPVDNHDIKMDRIITDKIS